MTAASRKALAPIIAGCALIHIQPAGAEELKAICPDRPGWGAVACTVDEGHWQAEIGLWSESFQHRSGVTTDATSAADPTVKYGVGDNLDIEASFALYQSLRIHDANGGKTATGVGDLYLHAKWNPDSDPSGTFAWVLDPFIKLPTANRALGDGRVEAGLQVPMAWQFPGGWSLGSTPEADLLLNASGAGYHAALVDMFGLYYSMEGGFTPGLQIWTEQNQDPSGTQSQYGIGPVLAWLSDNDTQFDGGIAFGLNRPTPDLCLYIGYSRRF